MIRCDRPKFGTLAALGLVLYASLAGSPTSGAATFEPAGISQPPAAPCGCTKCGGGQEGVYLFSGEFHLSVTDLDIAGRGLHFAWTRKFRSALGPNTAMGNGWDFAYNIFIEPSGADLVLHDGNTREDLYVFQPATMTWEADGFFREFTQEPDLSYTLTFADTSTWRFFPLDGSPSQGKISEISDRNGNTMVFEYGGLGELLVIHDPLDTAGHTRDITITYSPDGLIEAITDFGGRTVTYAYYDGIEPGGNFGDLKSVTSPAVMETSTGNDFPAGQTTVYTYSTGFADPALNGNLLTITDPKGQARLTIEYAPTVNPLDPDFDRVIRQIRGDPSDIIDVVYTSLAPDPGNNLAVIKATVNDGVGNVSEHYFDGTNHHVMQRDFTGRADPSLPTNIDLAVNPPLNPVRFDDPPFFETRYEWNGDSLVTLITHPNGNATQNVYEQDLDPLAPRRARGKLRERHRLPGPLGGDQAQIDEFFEYDPGFGGCCGTNFVTRWTDGRGNDTQYFYDANGNRTRTVHRLPSIVEDVEYNAFGQLTRHVHPDNGSGSRREDRYTYYVEADGCMNGYLKDRTIDGTGFNLTTTYEYDCLGRLTRTIDPRGNDAFTEYNALDQVVRTTSRETEGGSGVRYQVDNYYDANGNIVRVDIENRDEQGALQPNTHFTAVYEYDVLNYVTRSCREVGEYTGAIPGPAELPGCDGLPDNDFVRMEFEYDANRNRTLSRSGEAAEGRQTNNVVRTLYDERDLPFQIIRGAGDAGQSTTQLDYDANHNLTRRSEGLEDTPRITLHTYDGYDRLWSPVGRATVDPMGNVAEYHYDPNNNLTRVHLEGELIDLGGDTGNVRLGETTYEYDAMNRMTRTVQDFFDTDTQQDLPGGQQLGKRILVTEFSDNSQVKRTVDDNGHQTLTTYDTANRVSTVTDQLNNGVSFTYDPNSNVLTRLETEKSDLLNPDNTFATTYEYDSLDRLTRTVDNAGNVARTAFDSRGNRIVDTDPLGNQVRYAYDGINRLTRITRFTTEDGTGTGTPTSPIVINQDWDDNSRLISQSDDLGNETTHEYDSLNRMTRTTMADGTSITSSFDVHDNRLLDTDANGTVVALAYDLLNRTSSETVTPAAGVSTEMTAASYRYDGRSRLVSAADEDSIVTRGYDSLSQVLRETLTIGTSGVATVGTTTATYDGEGNQLTCAYPGGRLVTCTYDGLDRPKTIADGSGTIGTYYYIGPSRVERRDLGNGTRTQFSYDGITGIPNPSGDAGVKQIIGVTHTVVSPAATIADQALRWDAMGNKRKRDDLLGGVTTTYEYDSIYRLTRSIQTPPVEAAGTQEYVLDGAGNRADTSGTGLGDYLLDPLAPLADQQVNQYSLTPAGQREYDDNGNLLRMSGIGDFNADGIVDLVDYDSFAVCMAGPEDAVSVPCRRFDTDRDGDTDLRDFQTFQALIPPDSLVVPAARLTYDYRNQLVAYDDGVTRRRHTYAYDALRRRIAKVVDIDGAATETRYFYNGWQVVEEQDGAGVTQASYVYGRFVDEPLTMQRGGTNYYYHADDNFNVIALTSDDAPASVVERFDYGDFARPVRQASLQAADQAALYDSDPNPNPVNNIVELIADDFTFATATRITLIRWWGGYEYDPTVPASDDFTIRIYNDAAGLPGALLREERPRNHVARTATGQTVGASYGQATEFVYELALHEPFDAVAGSTYWLEISSDTAGGPSIWGWSSSAGGTGQLAFTHDGGPWGTFNSDASFELITDTSAVGNPYLFTGRRYDPETGLYYYRTRYLDPTAGRFTTRDLLGMWGDTRNLGNAYTFVANNPWSRLDPLGLASSGSETVTVTGPHSTWEVTFTIPVSVDSCADGGQARPTWSFNTNQTPGTHGWENLKLEYKGVGVPFVSAAGEFRVTERPHRFFDCGKKNACPERKSGRCWRYVKSYQVNMVLHPKFLGFLKDRPSVGEPANVIVEGPCCCGEDLGLRGSWDCPAGGGTDPDNPSNPGSTPSNGGGTDPRLTPGVASNPTGAGTQTTTGGLGPNPPPPLTPGQASNPTRSGTQLTSGGLGTNPALTPGVASNPTGGGTQPTTSGLTPRPNAPGGGCAYGADGELHPLGGCGY